MVFELNLCDLAQKSYGLFSNDMQKHMKSTSETSQCHGDRLLEMAI